MLTWIDWLMILGYFGVLAGVVVFSLRRNKIESGEDLFLGGASRSKGIRGTIASVFGAKVETLDVPDSAALGGAILASRPKVGA